MSLTSCLAKAGKNISAEDKSAIHATARLYRLDGMPADNAARRAVDEQISIVQKLMDKLRNKSEISTSYTEEELKARDARIAEKAKAEALAELEREMAEDVEEVEEVSDDTKEEPATEKGESNTIDGVRAALTLRFGNLVQRMEKRGFLMISDKMEKTDATCLCAPEIEPGEEVGALLFEIGGKTSLKDMLGDKIYAELMTRVQDLSDSNDATVTKAKTRIDDDSDECLLASVIQTAAEQVDRPASISPQFLKLLSSVVTQVRKWWAQTPQYKILDRYGQAIQLSPDDIGALALQAVDELAEESE